jgi:autotransporter-associated beta strand protein
MKTCRIKTNLFAILSFSLCAGLLAFSGASLSRAGDGIWASDSDGNWSDISKWASGVVADGPDSTAYFTNDVTAVRTVTLDSARTNGNLVLGDGDTGTPGGWVIAGSTLTLSNSSAKPTISVSAVNPPGSTNDAWIASVLSGSQGFIKTGAGSLTLAGNNTTLTNGGIFVQQGILVCGVAGAFGPTAFNKTNQFDGGMVRLLATPNNHTWIVTPNGGAIILSNGAALNFNSQIAGSGTLSIIASNQLTLGNNTGNVFSNFTGIFDMNGVGNGAGVRVDPGNGNVNIGNAGATFDLGNNNGILFTRYNLAGGTNTFFMGALKGGPATILRATSQGLAGGSTTIFQIGTLNVPTTFDGSVRNGTGGSGVQATAITKTGTASLTLSNPTNSYSGATVIANGALILTATGAISNSVSIMPLGNGVFDVSAYAGLWTNSLGQTVGGSGTVTGTVAMTSGFLSPGFGTNIARLTFANDLTLADTLTNLFKIGFGGTNDSVQVLGDLNLAGITTVEVFPPTGASLIPNGLYPLFKWNGALSGDLNNLTLVYPAQVGGSTLVLQTNLVAKTISLSVANNAAGALTWRGDGAGNVWDHSTPNWRTGSGGSSLFSELDAVTFDDTGSNNVPVDLTETVTPSSVVVINTNRDYVFSGSGKITGVTGLTKNGSGKLTVVQNNDFSGTVSINAGAIQIGDAGANSTSGSLGIGSVVNNATLIYSRSDQVTLSSALLGGGTLVQNGTNFLTGDAGTLILTADNNANNVLVTNGTLQLGDGTSGQGSVIGTITNNATLRYFYNNDAFLKNGLSGNGVINYDAASGSRTYTFPLTVTNSGFTGTMNLAVGIRLHADTGNVGFNFGNRSVVNVPSLAQAWVDTSASNYNQTFVIAGTGWSGDPASPGPLGALRLFNCTLTGPVIMTADSRIGGSSSGATIQGQISGPFQLEIFGGNVNPDVFVLTLAPSNGPNTYASTLITRGVLQAGNTNAFTNAVTMTGVGRLRLNGNNISIASLSGGTPLNGTNCLVWNNSASTAATLTVGTDDTSTTFDGIFGNGAAAALGLNKVGAGVLTLSAISTNTGPVTVSAGTLQLVTDGSFSNSTKITVAGGATLDVTARTDGSLNLTSGQTLGGSGTVNGTLVAGAGSIIAPGSSVGTLTVANNITLGGGMLMELNRSLSPNGDRLVSASGAITGGGTLTVTNSGPALQAGDTFQLFLVGVSGIAANLPATDPANGRSYTWQNNLAANGSIKVLTSTVLEPPVLTNSVSGNSITFSWSGPFKLQAQTNSLSVGLSGNWTDYPGGNTSPVVVSISATNPSVFFRLAPQ